jgi:DNA (cytosine-5)-methyltransferase 3A
MEMNVLSLFDGMSCGQIALERAGIKVDKYFASEVDKYAIEVTQKNYPDTIQLGDVSYLNSEKGIHDLLIGGSPCQGFSFAGKQLNFNDPRSKLFFEFVRLLNEAQPKYFLLENVKMKKEYQDVISSYLGVEPIGINSSLVSAQNRKRLYWTNIPGVTQPKDKGILLKDIIDYDVFEYNRKNGIGKKLTKALPLLASDWRGLNRNQNGVLNGAIRGRYKDNGKTEQRLELRNDGKTNTLTTVEKDNVVIHRDMLRALTPLEMERLQTVPEGYTDYVSDTQRKKMLGNGWTVDVIAHIFKGLTEKVLI